MPKYPAIDQIIVPVQVPKTMNNPAKRECLTVVCAVMKKLGPGVMTAIVQIDATLKSMGNGSMIISPLIINQSILDSSRFDVQLKIRVILTNNQRFFIATGFR